MSKLQIVISVLMIAFTLAAHAQHRGDNLSFQGLAQTNQNSPRALAMGGTFTGISGDVGAIHWNPAGLSDINGLQVTLSAAGFDKLWQENQDYRPNRFLLALPFYLEGLYIPDPANNGRWDYDIFNEQRDSTYVVNPPILGEDRYSEKVADWQFKKKDFRLDNVAIAYPFRIGKRSLTVAAAYNRKIDVMDYDRNDTYLDPHIGYDYYGVAPRVVNDTLRMNWSRFERARFGSIDNIAVAASFDVSKKLSIGLGLYSFSGDSQDSQSLDRVGWFDLANNNRLRFSYDTLSTQITGTSSFKGMNGNVGFMLKLNNISLGLNLTTPYSVTRTWENTMTIQDSTTTTILRSAEDKMEVPMAYRVGISITPIRNFRASLDIESIPYSNNTYRFDFEDETHRDWADVKSLSFGVEYQPFHWLALMSGYRAASREFVPDGAAFRDRGPLAETYSIGASLYILLGRFDVAYSTQTLKYYDSYYSNTNYALEKTNYFMLGYTYMMR